MKTTLRMEFDEGTGTGSRRNPITTKELDTDDILGDYRYAKKNETTMIPPMAECVGSFDRAVDLPSTENQPYLPVAQSVTILNQASQAGATAATAEVQVELVPLHEAGVSNTTDDSFNTPSVQSFVTPENERANMSLLEQIRSTQKKQHHFGHCLDTPATQDLLNNQNSYANVPVASHNRCRWLGERGGVTHTITGDELLSRLKKHRKKATVRSGLVGGLVGFIFLGPIGALGIGAGSAAMTKHRLKRREKSLRNQLDGRLNQPLPVLSNSTGTGSITSRRRCHWR